MHVAKERVPVKMTAPGAVARQLPGFGDRGQPEETCAGGDLFYWPPGHSVRVTENAEVIPFSPEAEHTEVIDHMADKLAALTS